MQPRATSGLVSLLIGWKNGARPLNQSLSEVMQNQSNSLITFDTHLKTALWEVVVCQRLDHTESKFCLNNVACAFKWFEQNVLFPKDLNIGYNIELADLGYCLFSRETWRGARPIGLIHDSRHVGFQVVMQISHVLCLGGWGGWANIGKKSQIAENRLVEITLLKVHFSIKN